MPIRPLDAAPDAADVGPVPPSRAVKRVAGTGLLVGGLVGAVLLPLIGLDGSTDPVGSIPIVLFGALYGLALGASLGGLSTLPVVAAIVLRARHRGNSTRRPRGTVPARRGGGSPP